MYEKVFREYIECFHPDLETDRKDKAIKIMLRCIKDKDNLITELDNEYEKVKYTLPIIVAKKFQKLFYKNFEERTNYELEGRYYINSYMQKEIDTRCYPYIFEKGTLEAELVKNGTIPNNIPFKQLMVKVTGEIYESETSVFYKSYCHELSKILDKVKDVYMENVISRYTEGILKYPYDQYEDIKEAVNDMFFNAIGSLSTFRYLDDGMEFVWYVGWEGITLNDILEMSKKEI